MITLHKKLAGRFLLFFLMLCDARQAFAPVLTVELDCFENLGGLSPYRAALKAETDRNPEFGRIVHLLEPGPLDSERELRRALRALGLLPAEVAAQVRAAFAANEIGAAQVIDIYRQHKAGKLSGDFASYLALHKRVWDFVPGGKQLQAEADALNNVMVKVASGKQKVDAPREVIGAHSAHILDYPNDYQILEKTENANGTIAVRFKKRVVDPVTGKRTWSKTKASTLAPKDWDLDDIQNMTGLCVINGELMETRERDGAQRFRLRRNVEWEVWVDKNGHVTSSYPTGESSEETF